MNLKFHQESRIEDFKSVITEYSHVAEYLYNDYSKYDSDIFVYSVPSDTMSASEFVRDTMLSAMNKLHSSADKAEVVTSETYWPFPAYDKLLFGV